MTKEEAKIQLKERTREITLAIMNDIIKGYDNPRYDTVIEGLAQNADEVGFSAFVLGTLLGALTQIEY